MFMRTYANSRVKRKSFYRKSELTMFLFMSGGHIGTPKRYTNMGSRLHTKLNKGAWNVSENNSETVGHKDLRLGQIVYILVFYNISFFWLLPLDRFQFFFVVVAWQWKRSIKCNLMILTLLSSFTLSLFWVAVLPGLFQLLLFFVIVS